MSKTTRTPKTASKSPATSKTGASKAAVAAPAKPRRRKGPVLDIPAVELPRVPAHDYGWHRHVGAVEPGDTIYLGGPRTLSTLEVAEIRPEKDGRHMSIVALAVEFTHEGTLYTGNEQVTLLADTNTRIGVKNV